jgi:hypothetical protein
VFKVSRIRGEVGLEDPKGEDADYTIPPGFRVRDHLGKTRWEYQDLESAFTGGADEKPFTASVSFPVAVAGEVRSLARSAKVVGQKAGKETLEFEVQQKLPFLRFLLRYVPNVEVHEPKALLGDLRGLAEQVLKRYEGVK